MSESAIFQFIAGNQLSLRYQRAIHRSQREQRVHRDGGIFRQHVRDVLQGRRGRPKSRPDLHP